MEDLRPSHPWVVHPGRHASRWRSGSRRSRSAPWSSSRALRTAASPEVVARRSALAVVSVGGATSSGAARGSAPRGPSSRSARRGSKGCRPSSGGAPRRRGRGSRRRGRGSRGRGRGAGSPGTSRSRPRGRRGGDPHRGGRWRPDGRRCGARDSYDGLVLPKPSQWRTALSTGSSCPLDRTPRGRMRRIVGTVTSPCASKAPAFRNGAVTTASNRDCRSAVVCGMSVTNDRSTSSAGTLRTRAGRTFAAMPRSTSQTSPRAGGFIPPTLACRGRGRPRRRQL